MGIRLAFCGASGTGKTTVMDRVSRDLGLPICPVGSRSVSKAMGFDSPYGVDAAGMRAEFQRRLFEEKREWEQANEDFVTDRTHFDNLAYTLMHDAQNFAWDDFQRRVVANERYSHVVFFPISAFHAVGGDPHRVSGYAYHVAYDVLLEAMLRRYGFADDTWVHYLGVPGVVERVQEVKNLVNR